MEMKVVLENSILFNVRDKNNLLLATAKMSTGGLWSIYLKKELWIEELDDITKEIKKLKDELETVTKWMPNEENENTSV